MNFKHNLKYLNSFSEEEILSKITVDLDILDIYDRYGTSWSPVDVGNYDDVFEIGMEVGRNLQLINQFVLGDYEDK